MYSREVELGGRSWRVRYDFNALADLEEKAGESLGSLFESEKKVGFNAVRLLVWAGIRHEDRGLTTQRVGLLLESELEKGRTLDEILEVFMATLKNSAIFKTAASSAGDDEKNS